MCVSDALDADYEVEVQRGSFKNSIVRVADQNVLPRGGAIGRYIEYRRGDGGFAKY